MTNSTPSHRCGSYTQEPNPNDVRAQTRDHARVAYGRNIHEQRGILPLHSRQTIKTIGIHILNNSCSKIE